jgi:hypothetical protein
MSEDSPHPAIPQRGREFENPELVTEFHSPHPALPQRGREFESPQGGREFQFDSPAPGGREIRSLPLAPLHAIAVQRSNDDTLHPDPPPPEGREVLQGTWYEAPMGVSRVSAGADRSASHSVAPSAGPHQASEAEMDELARKLYDRIRGRLKTELLVDRERAGFLTDLR